MRNSALMGCMSQRAGERRGRVSTYSGYSFLISRGTRSAHRLIGMLYVRQSAHLVIQLRAYPEYPT